MIPTNEELTTNSLGAIKDFREQNIDSLGAREKENDNDIAKSHEFDQMIEDKKQGKAISQTELIGPNNIVSKVLPDPRAPFSGQSSPPSLHINQHEVKDKKSFPNAHQQSMTRPAAIDGVNEIKLTTANEKEDLQFITVYYKQDDEEKAAKEIHRKLETIINDTNTDLISILQSYGFTGDPYTFQSPTTPIPIPTTKLENGDNGEDAKIDSSLIIQGEVLKRPSQELPNEEETTDSSQVSFKIFTYNKTENSLKSHSSDQTSQNQMKNMHDSELDQSTNRNKAFFENRFVPRRFDEIPKASTIDTKVSIFTWLFSYFLKDLPIMRYMAFILLLSFIISGYYRK